jgi:mRNA-degrading endonuclease RelE of RelBE toxin-antitoxin system
VGGGGGSSELAKIFGHAPNRDGIKDFRRDLARLPTAIRRQVRDAYRLFGQNPHHPSLKFKKLPPHEDLWSVRIDNDYRAIG